jgi:hypothetical protein
MLWFDPFRSEGVRAGGFQGGVRDVPQGKLTGASVISPRTIRIGEGYYEADLRDALKRYIPRAELKTLLEDSREEEQEPPEERENPKSNGEG